MKKILFGMMAATAMLFSSCSQDDFGAVANGDEATVSVSLSIPQIESRAYGDGFTATNLQYAVYDITTADTPVLLDAYTTTDAEIHGRTTINFKLVNGHTYGFVFWAAAPTAPYTVDFAADGATMTIDYGNTKANAEDHDAFYAYDTLTVNGDMTKDFHLYRPFAQVNVGTSDYDEAEAVQYVPTSSRVVVTGVYDTLDLMTGKVSGTSATRTYAYGTINKDEQFPVEGHDYLAMAYVLVPDEDQAIATVQFSYRVDDGGKVETRQVGSVPLKRNYRTNLFGQVLTSNAEVNVIIEPDWTDDINYDELTFQAAVGGSITLTESVTQTIDLIFRKDATLNLNDQTLTMDNSTLTIAGGANLTINGDGTIAKTGLDAYKSTATVYVNHANSSVTINGGTITSDGVEAVFVQVGTAYITGGYFAAQNTSNGKYFTLNCNDANFANGTAKIIVTGGTFEKFDPAETYADLDANKQPANLVAEGYKSVEVTINNKRCYMVVPKNTEVVDSKEELADAISKDDATVKVLPGTYDQLPTKWGKGVTVECEPGTTFTGSNNGNINGGTLIGGTFTGATTLTSTVNGNFIGCEFVGGFDNVRWCYTGETCYFEDCLFAGTAYACHFDGGKYPLTFKNCTFEGFNAFAASIPMLTFDNCTFRKGKSAYNGINAWGSTEMINCEWYFNGEASDEWIDAKTSLVMQNCTINGVAASDPSVKGYFTTADYQNVTFK